MSSVKLQKWKPKKPYASLSACSKRLEVRPLTIDDFSAWRDGHLGRKPKQHRFDEETVRASTLTRESYRKLLRRYRAGARKKTHFNFGIFDRKSEELVGFIGFMIIERGMRWANLGYGVQNQFWGQGIAPEAARLCLELGFGPLDLHRIEASCEPANKASAKVAIRAGLRAEGLRRKFFAKNGGVDLIVFAENQIDFRRKHGR